MPQEDNGRANAIAWFQNIVETPLDQRRLAEVVDPRIIVTTGKGEAPIEMRLEADDNAKAYLLDFARCFYFGEG